MQGVSRIFLAGNIPVEVEKGSSSISIQTQFGVEVVHLKKKLRKNLVQGTRIAIDGKLINGRVIADNTALLGVGRNFVSLIK